MSEQPVSLNIDLKRSNLMINQRCGNCKHLKRIANPEYEKLCKDLGMTDISKPCERFSVDPSQIKFKNDRNAKHAVEFLQDLSDDKLHLFASMIIEQRKSRRYGFYFGQPVYIKAFGGDYLSNYRRLKVVSADRKYVHLQADHGFTAMVHHDSVLTPAQWVKTKKRLIAEEKLVDPKYKKYTQSATHAELQIQRVLDTQKAQDFDSTNRHDFALTSGHTKRTAITRATPLTDIMKITTR